MSKVLITAEKPDAAKKIAMALGVDIKNKGGFFEDDSYIITWAIGHLIRFKKTSEMKEEYKTWSFDPLPMKFNLNTDLTIDNDKKKQFSVIKKLINRSDVSYIVNAGDADREGLLIQEEIYKFAGNKKPIKMLWVQSQTESEIVKGMAHLKERSLFLNLLEEAKARQTVDYMFGISYTWGLALTVAKNNKVSYGRCQTPLLKLLSDREKEIKSFKVSDYFEIEANFQNLYSGILFDKEKKENVKFNTKEDAENTLNSLKNKGKVIEYKKEQKKEAVTKLYSLSLLQKEMGSKFHFTAKKTLQIAQSLYEMKLTSYPRTDTEYINDDVFAEIDDRIKAAKNLIKVTDNLDKERLKVVCKPNKVTGHHAILPTDTICSKEVYESLKKEEKIVYIAICKKFLSVMLPDFEYYSINVLTDVNGYIFKSSGTETISLGWKELYKTEKTEKDEDKEEEKEIPELVLNNEYDVINKKILSKQTKAPARYTASSIINLMEKWMIGRPATQADIIDRLINMGFVEFNNNKYSVTNKGLTFIDVVLDELKDPNLTKNIEEKLSKIANNEYTKEKLIEDVFNNQLKRIDVYKKMASELPKQAFNLQKTDFKCPLCNSELVSQKYTYNCSNEKCGFKVNKVYGEKKIPEKAFIDLFTKGKTGLLKKLKGKTGKEFNARLVIDKEKRTAKYEFENSFKK